MGCKNVEEVGWAGRLVRSSMDRTWEVVGVGGSLNVSSSEIIGKRIKLACKQLDALSPFNSLSEYFKKIPDSIKL